MVKSPEIEHPVKAFGWAASDSFGIFSPFNFSRRLRNLEIVGARLEDDALFDALRACPNLTHLLLLGCEGLRHVSIQNPNLEQYFCFYEFIWWYLGNLWHWNHCLSEEFNGAEIDFVEFFNSHPKLQTFDIHGAMFAAIYQKNNLKYVDSRFQILCLEKVVVTVRSLLNAEQKMSTLDSLIRFRYMNCKIVLIE
ncbi:hypothetical protein ACS0TY_011115 [Phlomoides rotata]